MAKLTTIEGIGETYANAMSSAGIETLDALLKAGRTKKGRQSLAEQTDISEKHILKWMNKADLTRIKGVSTQYADLLEYAGVDTVPELARRNATNLQAKMAEVNTEKQRVKRVPSLSEVEKWVTQAKDLPRAIEY